MGEVKEFDEVRMIPGGSLDNIVNIRENESCDYKYIEFDLLNSGFQRGITTAIVTAKSLVKVTGIVCTLFTSQIIKPGTCGMFKLNCGHFNGKFEKVVKKILGKF